MHRLVFLVLSVAGCSRCSEKPAEPPFAEALRAKLAELNPDDSVVLKANGTIEWSHAGKEPAVIAARNYFEDYQAGEDLERLAGKIMAAATVRFSGNQILLGVRERQTIESSNFDRGAGTKNVFRPLGGRLVFVLLDDGEETMVLLNGKNLRELDAGFDELFPRARGDLVRRTPPQVLQISEGLWALEGDDYASAQILLGDTLSRLKLQGPPVVAVLGRYTVLAAGSRDARALAALAAEVRKHAESLEGRDYFPTLLIERDGGWADYEPPAQLEVEAIETFSELRFGARKIDSAAQTAVLRARADGGAPFIAELTGAKVSGKVLATAVWPMTLDTLLPEVDVLMLASVEGDEPKMLGFVPWARFREVMGAGCLQTSDWPPRFRVSKFPGPAQLEQLAPTMKLESLVTP